MHSCLALSPDITMHCARDVTPPLDEEEELEDSRRREALSRPALEADGCPPCYPTSLDIPDLQNPPEECRAIVAYWLSFPGTSGIPLTAQLIAWRKFRTFQQRTRRKFTDFEHELRQRRQRHGLDSPDTLTVDFTQQSRLERWIEYQNYQLARLETMQRERDVLAKDMTLTQPQTAEFVDALTRRLGASETNIKQHMVLLHWIEQQRQAMLNPGGDVMAPSDGGNAPVRRAPVRAARKRENTSASLTLDKRARISKPNAPSKGRTRHQRSPGPKTASTKNLVAPPLKTALQRQPQPRNATKPNKPRRVNDNLVPHLLDPQKVTKRQPQSRGLVDRHETVTRSGRKSKPPERWVPE